jgi:hypothetical protein
MGFNIKKLVIGGVDVVVTTLIAAILTAAVSISILSINPTSYFSSSPFLTKLILGLVDFSFFLAGVIELFSGLGVDLIALVRAKFG